MHIYLKVTHMKLNASGVTSEQTCFGRAPSPSTSKNTGVENNEKCDIVQLKGKLFCEAGNTHTYTIP